MATIQNTKSSTGNTRSVVVAWTGLTSGDDGDPVQFSQYTDKSVQVFGTFGAGGSLRIEGSNDGANWAVLTDPQGNDLVFTAAKIEMVTEATLHVRPKVTTGDGTTSLTASMLMKE